MEKNENERRKVRIVESETAEKAKAAKTSIKSSTVDGKWNREAPGR
jgi:hypothetical protein